MFAVALWETDDWHGRHFAPALPASIVWEIVNIWHCQTTTTHLYPCGQKAQNSPPVSYLFVLLFRVKNCIGRFMTKMRRIKLILCGNSMLFRRCGEEKRQLPRYSASEKNGSVLPLPKYLLHFHSRFLLRCFASICHRFRTLGVYLIATLVFYVLMIVFSAHVVYFLLKMSKFTSRSSPVYW